LGRQRAGSSGRSWTPAALSVPRTLRSGHRELRQDLAVAVALGGRTGLAARRVEELIQPHVAREEEFALPPLSLLGPLTRGEDVPDPEGALALTHRLEAELDRLVREHDEIASALQGLMAAAQAEGRQGVADFAKELIRHFETEEELLYPAALLVGILLRRRTA